MPSGRFGLDDERARRRPALKIAHGTRKHSSKADQLDAHVVAVRQRQAQHELQRTFLAFVGDAEHGEHHAEGDDGGEPDEHADVEAGFTFRGDQQSGDARERRAGDEPAVEIELFGDQFAGDACSLAAQPPGDA